MIGHHLNSSLSQSTFVIGEYNNGTSACTECYSSGTTYNTGDRVIPDYSNYNPGVWECLQDGTVGHTPPWNSSDNEY